MNYIVRYDAAYDAAESLDAVSAEKSHEAGDERGRRRVDERLRVQPIQRPRIVELRHLLALARCYVKDADNGRDRQSAEGIG